MRSYSVAALVLTLKPGQTNTQCYRVIQLRNVSIQQEGLKEEILTEIKSDIDEFSLLIDHHGVCGNNNKVCFVIAYNFNGKYAPEAGQTLMRTAFFTRAP